MLTVREQRATFTIMFWSTRYSFLVLILVLLVAAPVVCGGQKVTEAKLSGPPPNGCSVSLKTLRDNLGGYCRGPKKNRVIIFVNGIFGDAVDTWSNGDSYWPDLLAKDSTFDDSDIYVHSFKSPKIATAQEIDELAGRMSDFLEADRVLQTHSQVVFICHSMGGLITRAYILKARPTHLQIPMIYFYATPTAGANVAEMGAHLSENPQLKYMLPMDENGYVGDLQNAWLRTSDDPRLNYPSEIASYCAYELKDTWGFRVVKRESATNLCNRETRAVLSNHIGIVKPASPTDDPYVYFKAAYLHTFSPLTRRAKEIIKEQDENHPLATSNPRRVGFPDLALNYSIFSFKSKETVEPVKCGEDRVGTTSVSYSLSSDWEVLQVIPSLESEANLDSSSVALISYNDKAALVRYRLSGIREKTAVSCAQFGHADVVVNFVVGPARK
jgi:hypothetical protein